MGKINSINLKKKMKVFLLSLIIIAYTMANENCNKGKCHRDYQVLCGSVEGNPLGKFQNTFHVKDCLMLCESNHFCKGYEYSKKNRTCVLQENLPHLVTKAVGDQVNCYKKDAIAKAKEQGLTVEGEVKDNSFCGKMKRLPRKLGKNIGRGLMWGPKKLWGLMRRGAAKVKQGWQEL